MLTQEQVSKIAKLFREFADVLDPQQGCCTPEPVLTETKGKVKETEGKVSKKVEAEEVVDGEDYTKLSYNDLKAKCKELGVSAKGTKDELIERLSGVEAQEPEEEVDSEEVEETDEAEDEDIDISDVLAGLDKKELKAIAKELKVKIGAKDKEDTIVEKLVENEGLYDLLLEKGYISEEDEEVEGYEDDNEEDSDEDEEELEEQSVADVVEAEMADMSDDEIKELLEEIGVSSKGKRQALIAKVVKAVEDGLLSFDDEEDEAEEETVATEDNEEEEVEDTKARLLALKKLDKDIKSSYKSGELTDKDIADFISEYRDEKVKPSKKNLDEYIAISKSLVDDEGESHDLADPYYLHDVAHCCGNPLQEADDDTLVCEACGNEYEL